MPEFAEALPKMWYSAAQLMRVAFYQSPENKAFIHVPALGCVRAGNKILI